MKWNIVHSPTATAAAHMEADCTFLADLQNPLIHHYDWQFPSVTYGYFLNPHQYLCSDALRKHGIDSARRPTGGGVTFHMTDLAFSILVPSNHPHYSLNTLESYSWINKAVLKAVQRFAPSQNFPELLAETLTALSPASERFCMAHPTRYDVMWEGRKVGGAAQRRIKTGFLHQGSLCLSLPDFDMLNEVLSPNPEVARAMQNASYPLLGLHATQKRIDEARQTLRQLINQSLMEM